MTYEEEQTKGRALLDAHGLTDWRFVVENLRNANLYGPCSKGLLGYCDIPHKTIRIDHGAVRRQFRQTVLHEIAHALTPNDPGHGQEWINKAGEIGCTLTHRLPYLMALR